MAHRCSRCRLDLPEDQFFFRKDRGVLYSQCRDCHKRSVRETYQRHRDHKIAVQLLRKQRQKQESRAFVQELRRTTPCADCLLQYHWVAMQFDHVRGIKYRCVTELVNLGCSLRVVQREIAKCEIVCANCHAIRTYKRLGKE